jgi:hypothetical protein
MTIMNCGPPDQLSEWRIGRNVNRSSRRPLFRNGGRTSNCQRRDWKMLQPLEFRIFGFGLGSTRLSAAVSKRVSFPLESRRHYSMILRLQNVSLSSRIVPKRCTVAVPVFLRSLGNPAWPKSRLGCSRRCRLGSRTDGFDVPTNPLFCTNAFRIGCFESRVGPASRICGLQQTNPSRRARSVLPIKLNLRSRVQYITDGS